MPRQNPGDMILLAALEFVIITKKWEITILTLKNGERIQLSLIKREDSAIEMYPFSLS